MRILLFTGKGGVGKTTTACAAALRLAECGSKTLLLSVDPAHSLSDVLRVRVGAEPTAIAHGVDAVEVVAQPRIERAWQSLRRELNATPSGGAAPLITQEIASLPGVDQVLTLLAVGAHAQMGNWDVVVVDCASAGETLGLLALPEALGFYLRRTLPLQRRLARGARSFPAMLAHRHFGGLDGTLTALARLADDVAAVRELLLDPATTSVRLVTTPEAVAAAEARRTVAALAVCGYAVDGVIANRLFPTAPTEPWLAGWVAAQAAQLDELRKCLPDLDVRTLSYEAAEPVGLGALTALGRELYDGNPLAGRQTRPLLEVCPDGTDYLLRLALPFVDRSDLQAVRVDDSLIVTTAGRRRLLALPSVLRRCDVVGGDVVGAGLATTLQVRFRPDPQLWPIDWTARSEGTA